MAASDTRAAHRQAAQLLLAGEQTVCGCASNIRYIAPISLSMVLALAARAGIVEHMLVCRELLHFVRIDIQQVLHIFLVCQYINDAPLRLR